MAFVECWARPDGDDIAEGVYTGGIDADDPDMVVVSRMCPLCGAKLHLVRNPGAVEVRRVVRMLPDRCGVKRFIADPFPASTHHLFTCRACKIGFTVVRDALAAFCAEVRA